MRNLINKEFSEILNVHLALVCVANGSETIENDALDVKSLNRADDVGELTHARGLDKDTLGGVLVYYLGESLAEVANKATTDTARIHFVYRDARILKESAVDTACTRMQVWWLPKPVPFLPCALLPLSCHQ